MYRSGYNDINPILLQPLDRSPPNFMATLQLKLQATHKKVVHDRPHTKTIKYKSKYNYHYN